MSPLHIPQQDYVLAEECFVAAMEPQEKVCLVLDVPGVPHPVLFRFEKADQARHIAGRLMETADQVDVGKN
jgi:hypothetical protein